MNWNACLVDDRGHTEGEWNYTHNSLALAWLIGWGCRYVWDRRLAIVDWLVWWLEPEGERDRA